MSMHESKEFLIIIVTANVTNPWLTSIMSKNCKYNDYCEQQQMIRHAYKKGQTIIQ